MLGAYLGHHFVKSHCEFKVKIFQQKLDFYTINQHNNVRNDVFNKNLRCCRPLKIIFFVERNSNSKPLTSVPKVTCDDIHTHTHRHVLSSYVINFSQQLLLFVFGNIADYYDQFNKHNIVSGIFSNIKQETVWTII